MHRRTWRRALALLAAPALATTFLSLIPAPATAAGLDNGGFETGDFTSWTLRRSGPAPVIDTAIVKTGTYSAYLGSSVPEASADSQIMQTVAIPATGTTTLAFDWWPYSEEAAWAGTEGCLNFDWQDVLVFDDTGTTIGAGLGYDAGELMYTCSNAQTWQHEQFDLTPWAGMTIGIAFGVKQDSSVNTSMRVDDVTVTTTVPVYETSVTDVPDADAYTCSAPDSTVLGFEDVGSTGQYIDGQTIQGVTFSVGPNAWMIVEDIFNDYYDPAGHFYINQALGTGRMTFADPVADASLLVAGNTTVWLQAYDSADHLLATAGPAYPTYPSTMMRELRVTSNSEDIAYLVVHDAGNYFLIDDLCYSGLPSEVGTSTSLSSSGSPSVFGQPVDLTATVSPESGSLVPLGTVEFWEGSTKLGEDTLDGSGVASLTVSDFAVGSHSVTAKYMPDAGFTASEDSLDQVVNKADTTTVVNSVTPAHPTYPQTLSFDTTVAPVAPGEGTPTGDVSYVVNLFGNSDGIGQWDPFDPATDVLPAGTHNVEAIYAGDDNFNDSRSVTFVVTVAQAESSVAYLGDYLAIVGNDFTFKASVDSPVAACKAGREVTFSLLDGSEVVHSFTATSGADGAVTKTVDTTGWATGAFDVLVEVADSSDGNCAAADNKAAMDLVTVASPGDAATGGGWYFWKDSGASKRVNFGFTVSKQADNSYKGNLLLVNQGAWRLKGNLDSFTRADTLGQAGGTGTLYQWVCSNPSDPLTCSWQNPRAVSFKVMFTDQAAGKAKGKKGVVVDQFSLTSISVRNTTPPLPVSGLKDLKGGNIVLR